MWQKLKEQIPAVIITAALVIGACLMTVRQIVQQRMSFKIGQ